MKNTTARYPTPKALVTLVLLPALLLWGAARLEAQDPSAAGTVRGRVVTSSGAPVPGARVTIRGAGGEATTGYDGRFTVPNIPAGNWILRVTRLGYRARELGVEVKAGQEASVSVTLTEVAVGLSPVIVLGSRGPQRSLATVPAAITVVGDEEIRREWTVSARMEDILGRTVPGFNPTNEGVRIIRGRTAQVFLNGVPVNEQLRASSGSDLNLVAADQLARIEVARGANSAYGFGSPGGIIALSTPRASSTELTLETRLRGGLNPQHADGSFQGSLYQSVSRITGPADFHVGLAAGYDGTEFDPDGDLALGFANTALLPNAEEAFLSLDGSFGLDLGGGGVLRLTGTFGQVDFLKRFDFEPGVFGEEFGRLVEQEDGDRSWRRSYTANLTWEDPSVAGIAARIEAFAGNTDTEVYQFFGEPLVRDEQTNRYLGVRSSVTRALPELLEGSSVTGGIDFATNRYFRPAFDVATGEIVTYFSPDVTLDSYAFFGQAEIPLGSRILLTGGLRHEEYRGEAETGEGPEGIQGGDIRPFDLTLFHTGLVALVAPEVDVYASFSQGAEISQIGRAAREATTAEEIDPQPAKSNQYEVGVRGRRPALQSSLAAFYTESDLLSALQRDPDNPDGPLVPLREPREFWGVEASADVELSRGLSLGGVLTWQDGIRETAEGERRIGSREVPPLLLTGRIGYASRSGWRTTLQLDYRGERDPFGESDAFGEGPVDDVLLVNLVAGFDLARGTLRIGVENLFNTKYVSIPGWAGNNGFTYIPEEGTRVSTSYVVKW